MGNSTANIYHIAWWVKYSKQHQCWARVMGRCKQWNGLLEWNTGLDYWNKLFSFYGQVSEFILEAYFFMIYKYLATMDDRNNDNSYLLQCFHE